VISNMWHGETRNRVSNNRRIKAKDLVLDIRSGVQKSLLLNKHKLSHRELDRVLRKLCDCNLLAAAELDMWELSNHDVTIVRGIRQAQRRPIDFALRIQDADYPYTVGLVRDISECGVKVEGILVSVGDIKKLVLHSSESCDFHTVIFQAQCRWALQGDRPSGGCLAGLEITEIDGEALNEFRKLLVS
jgi:hypothetical protein